MKNNYQVNKYGVIFFLCFLVFACDSNTGSVNKNDESHANGGTSEFEVSSVSDYKFMFNENDVGGIINFSSTQFSQCSLAFALKNFFVGYKAQITEENNKNFDLSCVNDEDSFLLDPNESTFAKMEVVDTNKVTVGFELIGLNSRQKVNKTDVTLILSETQLQALMRNKN